MCKHGKPCASANIVMTDLSYNTWNLALKPLKTLYLRFHNACGHQTRQSGSLQWEASAHKITWPSKQMVLWDHVTNWNHYISTISVSGYQNCQDGNLPWLSIMARYGFISRSSKITWQTKIIISPLSHWLWAPRLRVLWLALSGSHS